MLPAYVASDPDLRQRFEREAKTISSLNHPHICTRVLACNLGNLWRRLVLSPRIKRWSLTSLQQRLVKTGGRLVKHARYSWLVLADGHLNRRLFGDMLQRIWALLVPGG